MTHQLPHAPPEKLRTLETPAVLVDVPRMERNITRMQSLADAHGLALRPHVKTHKSLAIAARQIAAGAVGLTASKVDEALVFLQGGFHNITVAYPVLDKRKLERLFSEARNRSATLGMIVDSEPGVAAMASAAHATQYNPRVHIKIDVGLHRCGVKADSPQVRGLADLITRNAALTFDGILSHAGHAYASSNKDDAARIAEEEREIMQSAAHSLAQAGRPAPSVSVGATPTLLAQRNFQGLTEIRPGNYVFLDGAALRLGLAEPCDVALFVIATVVSKNDSFLIIDAGAKTLTTDLGAHGSGDASNGYGLAWAPWTPETTGNAPTPVAKLSEEHGFIPRNENFDPALGDRVLIIPNHACPVVNLAHKITALSPEGELSSWKVDARGKVR